MAKIVCIATGTLRPKCVLGDIVEVVDDNVELGPAYNTFLVIQVRATKEEVAKNLTVIEGRTAKYQNNLSLSDEEIRMLNDVRVSTDDISTILRKITANG